jgi:cytochrome b561
VTQRYSTPLILLHWCTAILVILAYVVSEDSRHFGNHPPLLYFSLGLAVLVLTVARLGVRASSKAPAPQPTANAWLAPSALIVHTTLYLLLVAVPLSGWYVASRLGLSVSLLSWTVPPIAAPTPGRAPGSIGDLHQVAGNLLLLLVGLHVVAVLWHQFALKHASLKRMSPF